MIHLPPSASGLRQWSCLGSRPRDGYHITLTYTPDPSHPGQGTLELRLAGLVALTAKGCPGSILPKLVKLLPLIDVKRATEALELEK